MALFKFNDDSLLVSLDVGFYATCCAVSQKSEQFLLELLAFTERKTSGLEEAQVAHFEDLSLVFSKVLQSIEELCKSSFSKVCLGFSLFFHSFRSRVMVALNFREVTQRDFDLSIETAQAVPLPDGYAYLDNKLKNKKQNSSPGGFVWRELF